MTEASTIFALSSGPGRAGVAVIRVSGSRVREALTRMASPIPDVVRRAAFRTVRHPESGDVLDRAVVLWFAAPLSETGEDVAEFQVHGGPAVVSAVLQALGSLNGCRMAEPGEFVRRAFYNGKINLAEIEGLADLIEAETDAQRRQAVAQSCGALSKIYEGWRARLVAVAALTEAAIDFSDEADVAVTALEDGRARASVLASEIAGHLSDTHRGEILRDGFRVALLGLPNAGKSSLLNALARREAAIVSEEAGTTRDVIEVRLDLGGLPVIVSDTAGIRAMPPGRVEAEGIRRSFNAARAADLVIWLSETGGDSPPSEISRETALTVRSKADLVAKAGVNNGGAANGGDGGQGLAISSVTGDGLDQLAEIITARASAAVGDPSSPAIMQERHRQQLQIALDALGDLVNGNPLEAELRAEDVRRAIAALGRITGRVDAEDVLDQVFSRFCIGK